MDEAVKFSLKISEHWKPTSVIFIYSSPTLLSLLLYCVIAKGNNKSLTMKLLHNERTRQILLLHYGCRPRCRDCLAAHPNNVFWASHEIFLQEMKNWMCRHGCPSSKKPFLFALTHLSSHDLHCRQKGRKLLGWFKVGVSIQNPEIDTVNNTRDAVL